MSEVLLRSSPPIPVLLRRSARAKRYSLRVSRLDGRVTLTMPLRASQQDGLDFAQRKIDWIMRQLSDHDGPIPVTFETRIPLEGRLSRVVPVPGRRGALMGDLIEVPEASAAPGAYVEGLLKAAARERLSRTSEHYAARLGRPFSKITIRDTRSRWGSCSSAGGLMYSWRLIMAPPHVLDYVVAHEVAHLREMNHSRAFWSVVEGLFPDFQHSRAWLRDDGASLHRYRFRD